MRETLDFDHYNHSNSGLALEEKLETVTRTELIVDTEKEKHWVEGKIIKIGEKSYGYRDSQISVELYIAGTERYLQSQNDVPSKEKFGDSNYVYPSYVQNSKILGQYSLSSSFAFFYPFFFFNNYYKLYHSQFYFKLKQLKLI